jgi:hypothetical protein
MDGEPRIGKRNGTERRIRARHVDRIRRSKAGRFDSARPASYSGKGAAYFAPASIDLTTSSVRSSESSR